MSENNGIQKIDLRSKITKFQVGDYILECEFNTRVEQFLVSKLSEFKKIENTFRDAVTELGTIDAEIATEDNIDNFEEQAKVINEKIEMATNLQVKVYEEIFNKLFINGTNENALEICKDSQGEYNSVTMDELLTIVLNHITSKINTNLKDKVKSYRTGA